MPHARTQLELSDLKAFPAEIGHSVRQDRVVDGVRQGPHVVGHVGLPVEPVAIDEHVVPLLRHDPGLDEERGVDLLPVRLVCGMLHMYI